MDQKTIQPKTPTQAPKAFQGGNQTPDATMPGQPYLNHGTPSLVGMDNPDDSQLGSEKQRPTK